MTKEETVKKIDELYENEQFRTKAASCETVEEIIAVFKEEGVEITEKDFAAVENYNAKSELNADELDNVAGGVGLLTCLAVGVGAYAVYKFARGYVDGASKAWGKYCR